MKLICKNCGSKAPKNLSFCPVCGSPSAAEGRSRRKIFVSALSIHTLAIIIAIIAISGARAVTSRAEQMPDTKTLSVLDQFFTASPSPASEPLAELLDYIWQNEENYSAALEKISMFDDDSSALSESEFVERVRQDVRHMEEYLASCSALCEKKDAVSGLSPAVRKAADAYFDMASAGPEKFVKLFGFLSDYLEFAYTYLDNRPSEDAYEDLSAYYDDLETWFLSARKAYDSFDTCPESMTEKWQHLGEILDLNSTILDKLCFSYLFDDPLRYYSARFLSNRYETMEEVQYDRFLDIMEAELKLEQRQMGTAGLLADEFRTFAAMTPEEQESYEFKYDRTDKIITDFEAVDVIYPSLYQSYDAFVILSAGCLCGTRTIVVEAEIPGFTQKYRQTHYLDASYHAIFIKPAPLPGELALTSAKDAQINISVYEKDGNTLITSQTIPIRIKSINDFEWEDEEFGIATQDNILCFLTPESSAVTKLKRLAVDRITELSDGLMESFAGYQDVFYDHKTTTYIQAAGLMSALYETGVRYNSDGFSISGSNQHILLPEQVMEEKSGLCIETSLLVASALQSANMHAFLIFPPGHAQVAVEIWNPYDQDDSGAGEYFLIETTDLSADVNNTDAYLTYLYALVNGTKEPLNGPIVYLTANEWRNYLANNVEYVIDCDDSILLGLTPFAN